jgi:hypothetical protein
MAVVRKEVDTVRMAAEIEKSVWQEALRIFDGLPAETRAAIESHNPDDLVNGTAPACLAAAAVWHPKLLDEVIEWGQEMTTRTRDLSKETGLTSLTAFADVVGHQMRFLNEGRGWQRLAPPAVLSVIEGRSRDSLWLVREVPARLAFLQHPEVTRACLQIADTVLVDIETLWPTVPVAVSLIWMRTRRCERCVLR